MRVNLENGNGYVCDLCTKEIKPFDVVTIKSIETVKGSIYPKVSSDIREKQISRIHLCKGC